MAVAAAATVVVAAAVVGTNIREHITLKQGVPARIPARPAV